VKTWGLGIDAAAAPVRVAIGQLGDPRPVGVGDVRGQVFPLGSAADSQRSLARPSRGARSLGSEKLMQPGKRQMLVGLHACGLLEASSGRCALEAELVGDLECSREPRGLEAVRSDRFSLLGCLEASETRQRCGGGDVGFRIPGGGPPAYRVAVRHPDRVHALVACDCVSKAYPRPHENASDKLTFHTRAGQWLLRLLIAHSPKQVIAGSLGQEGDLSKEELAQRAQEVFDDSAKRQLVLEVSATVSQVKRKAGYDNDIERLGAIDDLELERITTPSLIVHGTADADVELDHGRGAAARIPNAELLALDTGTHFAFYTDPDADRAQARAIEYLAIT